MGRVKQVRSEITIQANQLKKGDQILGTRFVWEVRAIKIASFSDVSHVLVRVKHVGGLLHGDLTTHLYDQTTTLRVKRFVV